MLIEISKHVTIETEDVPGEKFDAVCMTDLVQPPLLFEGAARRTHDVKL